MTTKQEALKAFEDMRNMAKLRALSQLSIIRPLNPSEYKTMMQLKEKVFNQ